MPDGLGGGRLALGAFRPRHPLATCVPGHEVSHDRRCVPPVRVMRDGVEERLPESRLKAERVSWVALGRHCFLSDCRDTLDGTSELRCRDTLAIVGVMTPESTLEPVKCRRCKRALTSASSIAAQLGPRCAAIEAAIAGLKPEQAEKALEVIADGGVIPTSHKGVYRVSSSNGDAAYVTAVTGQCSCSWGLRRKDASTKTCYHVASVILVARPVVRRALAKAA